MDKPTTTTTFKIEGLAYVEMKGPNKQFNSNTDSETLNYEVINFLNNLFNIS